MIEGWIVGDKELVARLEAMPGKVHESIGRAVLELTKQLEGKVMHKLNNDVLHSKTGTLMRGVTSRVDDTPASVTGIVGDNVKYAAAHEYGFDGFVSVRSHLRKIVAGKGSLYLTGKTTIRVQTKTGRMRNKKVDATTVYVKAHQRHMHLPERSFLRSALREMDAQIKEQLTRAVKESIEL